MPSAAHCRAAARALRSSVTSIDLDAGAALDSAVPALGEMLGLELAVGYRMCRNAEATGYELDFFVESGPSIRDAFGARVGRPSGPVALYDPVRPEPAQQNRVLVHRYVDILGLVTHELDKVGLAGDLVLARDDGDQRLAARMEEARVAWNLTARQIEVLERLALGDANKEIANRLGMSVRTVEKHVEDVMRKARVESRLRLVARLWAGG